MLAYFIGTSLLLPTMSCGCLGHPFSRACATIIRRNSALDSADLPAMVATSLESMVASPLTRQSCLSPVVNESNRAEFSSLRAKAASFSRERAMDSAAVDSFTRAARSLAARSRAASRGACEARRARKDHESRASIPRWVSEQKNAHRRQHAISAQLSVADLRRGFCHLPTADNPAARQCGSPTCLGAFCLPICATCN